LFFAEVTQRPACHRKHELAPPAMPGTGGQVRRCGRVERKLISMFYTYILKSLKDQLLYIGWSDDLRLRIKTHNKGLASAIKDRRPLKLIYYEACLDKNKAIVREKYFKTGFGRRFLKDRI